MTNINISWGKKIFLIIFLIPVSLCNAYNTPHFYRATPFFLEPRFEKPWLSSLDIDFGRGHTSTGFDQYKNKVNILNIYGLHNMHQLGANRPHKHSPSITDTLLDQLANLPSPSPHFGLLSLKGSFNTKELNACFTQNLTRGFFIRAHIPLTTFNIKLISITDLTPEHDKHIPEWQAFLKAFNTILNEYHIEKKPIYKTHAGDTSVMVGWAINYQDTSLLDFIDFSIQGGILIPTGEKKK